MLIGGLGLLLLVSQLASCFNEPFDRKAMLESLGSEVIIPSYRWFLDETAALVSSAQSFCSEPTAASLAGFQAQWQSVRVPWKQMEVAAFGPYAEQPWRIGPKIDSWPVREDTIEQNLAGAEPLDVAHVSALGAASRGLPALEYLIFDPEGVHAALVKFEAEGGARRCEYAIGLSEDLHANADAMVSAWSHDGDDYLGALVASGEPGAPFTSVSDASNEIINRMLSLTESIMRSKLGQPLGLESGGEAHPDQVEAPYSGNSIRDIVANLDGLENIYRGRFDGGRGIGVQLWVRWYSPDTDQSVRAAIMKARWAVEAIPEPLSNAVVTQPDLVQAAYDQLRELRNVIGVDVINAIAGTVTFNETDGD